MAYTKDDLTRMGVTNLQEARKKIVDISIFDDIDDIKLTDKTKRDIDFTKEIYLDYLKDLNNFNESIRNQILKALMATETIDNHSLELENPNLLVDYSENHHSTAIRYLVKKLINEGQDLNDSIIKKTHEILMRGTSNETDVISGYRNSNNYYVGYVENGEKVINFFPIANEDIKESTRLLFDYYDAGVTDELEVFTKPFVVHGLLAALQIFEDGNTRMARTLQHVKLQTLTNSLITKPNDLEIFNLPAIYFSKNYIPYRAQYRELIKKLALSPHNEEWNNWIDFNLRRMQERIYANEDSLMLLSRTR